MDVVIFEVHFILTSMGLCTENNFSGWNNINSTDDWWTLEDESALIASVEKVTKNMKPILNSKSPSNIFKATEHKDAAIENKNSKFVPPAKQNSEYKLSLKFVPKTNNTLQSEVNKRELSQFIKNNESTTAIASTSTTQDNAKIEFINIKAGQIILLKENAIVYFYGIGTVTVVLGKVDTLGYILEKKVSYEINSPAHVQHISIRNVTSDNSKEPVTFSNFSQVGLKPIEISNLTKKLQKTDALLICKRVEENCLEFVENYFTIKLFPGSFNRFVFQDVAGSWDVTTIKEEWNDIVQYMKRKDEKGFEKVLITGASNSGKSVLARYLTNRLLTTYKNVIVIDLDPAQSEFTVSGCISISIINEPLFGPNFMHPKVPEYSILVGFVDILKDPNYYLKCVKNLMEYNKNLPNMPTVIQFNGLTDISVVSSIICITEPHRVIEVFSCIESHNFEHPVTATNVESFKNHYTPDYKVPSFNFHRFSAIRDESKKLFQSKILRLMRIVIYFVDTLPEVLEFPLNLIRSPSKTKLGQVLAICKVTSSDLYECHGWGIVNSISETNSTFTIFSPVILSRCTDFVFVSPKYEVIASRPIYDAKNYQIANVLRTIKHEAGFNWISEQYAHRNHSRMYKQNRNRGRLSRFS